MPTSKGRGEGKGKEGGRKEGKGKRGEGMGPTYKGMEGKGRENGGKAGDGERMGRGPPLACLTCFENVPPPLLQSVGKNGGRV